MVPHFNWSNEMSVGNSVIDEQHKRLLSQINNIIDHISGGGLIHEKDVIELLNFFVDYAKHHLTYEEEYMTKGGYPEIEDHKKKHAEFFQKYEEIRQRLNDGKELPDMLLADIETYLGSWWLGHIGREDQKYAKYFRSLNAK